MEGPFIQWVQYSFQELLELCLGKELRRIGFLFFSVYQSKYLVTPSLHLQFSIGVSPNLYAMAAS